MFNISKEEYGFRLTFNGAVTADEMAFFRLESVRALMGIRNDFGLVLDLRNFRPEGCDEEARQAMAECIELYRRTGVHRSCYILENGAAVAQYRRRQRESRTKFHERYINGETNLLWPLTASNWVANGIEPAD